METVLITTTIRHTRPGESSGYIYTVDLAGRRVTGQCPVIEPPYIDADPNPRGGMRGAKGIAVLPDEVFIANASLVYRFDRAWNLLGTISHPSCATIHDIAWQDNSLWVTSCSNDLVFQFDLNGRLLSHYNVRAYPHVLQALNWYPPNRLGREDVLRGKIDFRDARTHCHETFDGAHVNSLCFLPNGELLVLLGLVRSRRGVFLLLLKNFLERYGLWNAMLRVVRPAVALLPLARVPRSDVGVSISTAKAAILRIKPSGAPEVAWILPETRVPTHSLCPCPDGTVLLNDTTNGTIIHLDLASGSVLSRIKVTDEFLRGMCLLPSGRVLVGSQRDLLLVDVKKQAVLDKVRLSSNPNVSVYDIKVLPAGFRPLPERLSPRERRSAVACS